MSEQDVIGQKAAPIGRLRKGYIAPGGGANRRNKVSMERIEGGSGERGGDGRGGKGGRRRWGWWGEGHEAKC